MARTTGFRGGEPAAAVRTRSFSAWQLLLRIPEILVAILLALVMVFLVVSVISRYFMDLGLPWSDELSRLLFIWIVFLGFAIAVRHRANVGVDWLVDKLAEPKKKAVRLLQDVVVLGFAAFFTWQSYVTVGFSMLQRLPALDITIAWMYGSSLAAGVLMIVYGIANLVDTVRGKAPPRHDAAGDETHRIE